MYLEEETNKKSEVISCIFSLKEEVGALAKALRLFEVNSFSPLARIHITPSRCSQDKTLQYLSNIQ